MNWRKGQPAIRFEEFKENLEAYADHKIVYYNPLMGWFIARERSGCVLVIA